MNNLSTYSRRRKIAVVVGGVVLAIGVVSWWLWRSGDEVTIGVEGKRVVKIPGPRLTAIPFTHGDPLAVRIAAAEPTRSGFRYDIRFMAYGPGKHDLRDYLIDETQQRPNELPEMLVTVGSILPKDHKGELFDTAATPIDLHTRYSLWMRLLWASWALLLVPLLVYGRKHRPRPVVAPPSPTIPQRLRSLLEKAAGNRLSAEQQADLEKLLVAYWAGRLHLAGESLADTLDELRQHPAAGPQVGRVETWLHSRASASNGTVARELLNELAADLGSPNGRLARRGPR